MPFHPTLIRPPRRQPPEDLIRARLERDALVAVLAQRLQALIGAASPFAGRPPQAAAPSFAGGPQRAAGPGAVAYRPTVPPPRAFVPPPQAAVRPGPAMIPGDWFRGSQPGRNLRYE